MPKENNSKNIFKIPETQFSSELLNQPVDYIDYISTNGKDTPNLKIDIDFAAFDLDEDESQPQQPASPSASVIDYTHSEHFRRSVERNSSNESNEVLEIVSDLEKNRSEFLVSGKSLDPVKSGLIKTIFGGNSSRKAVTMEQLKAAEAKIGSAMYGETPGVRTEFFNDSDNSKSWFFYQETTNRKGDKSSVTLHYEVHPEGILRIKDNEINGCLIKDEELDNFLASARIYHDQVMAKIYKKQPYSDQRAA